MDSSGPEKKRKRAHRRQPNSGDPLAGKSAGPSETPLPRPPSDEEVDEFFGLLRRMHAAVKCYGKSGQGNGASELTASNGGERKGGNGVSFDLNVAPEETAEVNGE